MPRITVDMFSGRSEDQKRAIVKELTEGFSRATGTRVEAIDVLIREVEKTNWGQAGVLYSDKD